MFSWILKIVPKLDDGELKKMEKNLQSRFTKIAKGFGGGIMNALKGGGIAAIGLSLIDKILNPLKEVQEAIDRTLATTSDLSTNAKQFNTTSGKLAKLVALAKASGLDEGNLFMLIQKFQTAVSQAKANPLDPNVNSVKNFVGEKDTAEAFFGFIQQMKNLSTDQQVLVQQQVFGEKQILKMSEFLNADFNKLSSISGIDKHSSADATAKIDKAAGLNDLSQAMTAGRDFNDLIKKSGIINQEMVKKQAEAAQEALDRENLRIQSYTNLATLSMTAEKINGLIEKGVGMLGKLLETLLPAVERMANVADKFLKSPMMRGVTGLFGKKEE